MKRCGILLLLWLLTLIGYAEGFVINSYDADYVLKQDGSMDVTESIKVTFTEPRRGIYRVIPFDYETGKGYSRRIILSNIGVTDENGSALTQKITRTGGNLRIRVGDADIVLPSGTQKTYVFRYRAFGMLNRFEDPEDWEPNVELYWNVNGNEWFTNTEAMSVAVHFPPSANGEGLRAAAYVGAYGSRDNIMLTNLGEKQGLFLSDSEMRYVVPRSLHPGEGVTIVLSVPTKLIAKPSYWQLAQLYVLPNLGFALPFIPFFFMPILWYRFGRDPKSGPVVVQFEPPDGLPGHFAGALIDQRVDNRDVSSIFFSLAVKRKITFHPNDPDQQFSINPGANSVGLDEIETMVFNALQSRGPNLSKADLNLALSPISANLTSQIYEGLVRRHLYKVAPNQSKMAWGCLGVIAVAFIGFFVTAISPFKDPFPAVVGGLVAAGIILVYAQFMPRRTTIGAKSWAKVRGFYEFISRAKEQELKYMTKVEPTMALFEEYLPHAIAFGLATQWSQAFEGILTKAPDWYDSNRGFNPYWMIHDINNATTSTLPAALTPPRSSGASGGNSGFGGGGGGGGFSGGGFGGGGGGSW